jgi:hypothetical protein
MERVRQALEIAFKNQPPLGAKFSLADQLQRCLFLALCRRYGLKPYRYGGQCYTTVVRAPRPFVEKTLWPEYLGLSEALRSYLNEATERVILEREHSGDRGLDGAITSGRRNP